MGVAEIGQVFTVFHKLDWYLQSSALHALEAPTDGAAERVARRVVFDLGSTAKTRCSNFIDSRQPVSRLPVIGLIFRRPLGGRTSTDERLSTRGRSGPFEAAR